MARVEVCFAKVAALFQREFMNLVDVEECVIESVEQAEKHPDVVTIANQQRRVCYGHRYA